MPGAKLILIKSHRFKKGCNLFYKTLIYEKNYNNWPDAKESMEKLIARELKHGYDITASFCDLTVKNTLKYNNNLK